MLSPVELEMEGFRSFRKKTLIKFPEKGLMLLSGKWKDAPTGSGSGKSSVLLAMAFALGYCDRPATALKNWWSKKQYVRFRLTDGTSVYDVIREPKLSLIINGGTPIKEGAEEKLAAIMKTSPELAQALTYRRQRKPDETFLKKTDSGKKEFLAAILNLTKLETASDEFASAAKSSAAWIEQAAKNLEQMVQFVSANAVSQDALDKAKADFEAAAKRYDEVVQGAQSPELQQKLAEAQSQGAQVQAARTASDRAQRDITTLKDEFVRLGADVKQLKENRCFTCKREWGETGELLAQKEARAREIMSLVEQRKVIIANAQPLLNAEPEIAALIQLLNQQIGQLKAPIQDAYTAREMAASNLRRITDSKNSIDKAKKDCVALKQQIDEMTKKARIDAHAAAIMGRTGFMSDIFDEVLAAIERRTNEFMVYLPNVATYSLQISSVSTTKAGSVKKEISTKLIKDDQEVDTKDVSGGQQCSVELSADLSVAEEIRTRSGSPLGWIALDEAMDGLDVEPKKAALEAIRAHTKGLVIIVDHATEIKESFDSVVQIEFDGRDSYVVA